MRVMRDSLKRQITPEEHCRGEAPKVRAGLALHARQGVCSPDNRSDDSNGRCL